MPHRRAPVDWLPAPESRRAIRVRPASSRRPWLTPPRQSPGEQLMIALLATAALWGIAYGFVCLLNLVQNWALFNAGIAALAQ